MKVLILFTTIEGQTGKIARFVADTVRAAGHETVLTDAEEPEATQLDGIDAVILAAPVHQRRHPKAFEALVSALHQDLAALPTLLISVSMSAAFPEGQEEAAEYVTEMCMRTGLAPTETVLTAGAVRVETYDYFAMQVVRYVVLRNRDYDPAAGTHEFTDWAALTERVGAFLAAH